jgi:hypothetical protein
VCSSVRVVVAVVVVVVVVVGFPAGGETQQSHTCMLLTTQVPPFSDNIHTSLFTYY